VRDHYEYLEAIWWTYKVGRKVSIDKKFEQENTRRPVEISMNLGETLILHKSALFKIVNRRNGDFWEGKPYAFVSHVVDSTWDGPGNDVTQEYEPFHYMCHRPDTAGRYPWGRYAVNNTLYWPVELIDAAKESYNRICLGIDSSLPCYDFKVKPRIITDTVKVADVRETISISLEELIANTSILICQHLQFFLSSRI
jgi:hypothetical protein